MRKRHSFVLCVLMYISTGFLPAQRYETAARRDGRAESCQRIRFVENKGQVVDQNGKLFPDVLYYASVPGGKVYVTRFGVSYEFHKVTRNGTVHPTANSPVREENTGWKDDVYRVDMLFRGSNASPDVYGSGQSSDYNNYYLAHCPDGITNVRMYDKVIIRDVYPSIDFILYRNQDGLLQYDFQVHPGGKPESIGLEFRGSETTEVTGIGGLAVQTPAGLLSQDKPKAFQTDEVPCSFAVHDGIVRYAVGQYNANEDLTIDPPTRLWATYYGDSGDEYSTSVATDSYGDMYLAGGTSSAMYIASSGAHQTTIGGGNDGMVVKFTSSGSRAWCTYYGGSAEDIFYGIAINSAGVYVTGITQSSTAIATSGAYQPAIGGSQDGMIVKISVSGVRQWGTYYGGSGWDACDDICLDGGGNVIVTGITNSSSGIVTAGSHQQSIGGSYDAFVVKMTSSGARLWGTYYGGVGYDHGYDVVCDAGSNIILCGQTNSSTGISTTGSHQVSLAGGTDVMIVRFNSNGVRQWATYYGGTADDKASNICTDASSNLYVVGETSSTSGIATSGAHQSSYDAGIDGFIVKFSSSGVRQWGSFYAGEGDDHCFGVECDATGNVYFGGYTTSTTNMASSNGYQTSLSGSTDAILVKINANGVRQWATYYGGSSWEYCVNLAIDASGYVYTSGSTSSTSGIAYNGYQSTNDGGYEYFTVKWDVSGVANTITCSIDPTFWACSGAQFSLPYTATGTFNSGNVFQAQLSDQYGSFASPYSIGSISSTTSGTITCTVPSSVVNGTSYRLRVVSSSPNTIGTDNGSNLKFGKQPSPAISGTSPVCFGSTQQYQVTAVAGNSYEWNVPVRGTIVSGRYSNIVSINWNLGVGSETLSCRETNTMVGCWTTASGTVTINSAPTPAITGTASVCYGSNSVQYRVTAISGNSYEWSVPSLGTIVSGRYSNVVTINWNLGVGVEQLTIRETNSTTGCSTTSTMAVTVNPLPSPNITGPSSVCVGTRDVLYGVAPTNNHSYEWYQPQRGIITTTPYASSINIFWNTSAGTDRLRMRETDNATGCSKETEINISVNDGPRAVITGQRSSCLNGQIETYSVQNVSSYAFSWYGFDRGSVISGATTNSVRVLWDRSIGFDSIFVLVTDRSNGCTSAIGFEVEVLNAPKVEINGPRSACENQQGLVFRSARNPGSMYSWSVQTSNLAIIGSSTRDSVVVNARTVGVGMLRLVETSSQGCVKDTTISVTVDRGLHPEILVSGGVNSLCSGDSRLLECKLFGNTYQWKRNGVSIPGAVSRQYIAFQSGTYAVGITAGDCSGESDNVTLVEYPRPAPAILGPSRVAANQKSVAYQVSNQQGSQYRWESFGNATITSGIYNSVIVVDFFGAGNAFIKVSETDRNNCSKDTVIAVTVETSTSVNDVEADEGATVFPNPVQDLNGIRIVIPSRAGCCKKVLIYNHLGEPMEMADNVGENQSGLVSGVVEMSTSRLINGAYFVEIITNRGSYYCPFMVSR